MRTILFTGKGGVGKTTLAAATALHSATRDYRTLVISTDIAHSLADAFNLSLGNEPRAVGPDNLFAAELDTGEELERYWGDIKRRIANVLREEGVSAPVAGELAILPGLDEVLTLIRIKRFYDEGEYDTLIIDSAPTGAAMRLLAAPDLNRWYTRQLLSLSRGVTRLLLPALRSKIKVPIHEDAVHARVQQLFEEIDALREILTDSQRTSVRLVLNPDHLSVQETQRAYTYMNLFGLGVDALFVNRILPEEVQDPFFERWKADQTAHRQLVRELFSPLPVFEVPLLRREVVGLEELSSLSRQLYGDQDAIQPLTTEQPLHFYMDGDRYMLSLRVTGVKAGTMDLEKEGDQLRVKLGWFRRSLMLPQYLAGKNPTWAQIEGDYLKIAFEDA